jgi:hypothetical protein
VSGVRKCTLDDDELRRLRAAGLTLRAIAARAGVTGQAVANHLRKLQRRENERDAPAVGASANDATPLTAYKALLSVRAWNTLCLALANEDATVSDVRALGPELLRVPNCGVVSYAELCAVFGMTPSVPHVRALATARAG